MKTKYPQRILTILLLFLALAGQALAKNDPIQSLLFFLTDYTPRYEAYIAKNPNLPYDSAVALVNADADKAFYSDIITVSEPASLLVLCNKNNALPSDYVPEDLTALSGGHLLRAEAAEQFNKMSADAKKEGNNLIVYSAYRSYNTQKYTYEYYKRGSSQASADGYSARPGHSEHQTGLALDILHKYGSSGFRSARFQNTSEYKWLTENAYKYGFILRYPDGYTDITGYIYEPWHWRYVGIDTAKIIHDEGIATFEEYYGRYLAEGLKTRE